jgi:FMN phosphatase YigB (HAD superfamily)
LENHLEKYLFPKVKERLREIKDKKILLTFGDLEFQSKKVKELGLEKEFDEVILTDEHKLTFLKDFVEKKF